MMFDVSALLDSFSGEYLFNLFLGGALVALLGLAACRLSSRSSAAQRHLILASTMAGLALLPLIRFAGPELSLKVLPAPAISEGSVVETPSTAWLRSVSDTSAPTDTVENESPPAPVAHGSSEPAPRMDLIDLLYGLGVLIVIVPLLAGSLRMRWLVRRARPLADSSDLSDSIPAGQEVRILTCDSVRVPLAWGWRQSVLLLPEDAFDWSPAMRRDAITHELAHLDRRDLFFQTLGRVSLAVHWFNPLVWIAFRRMLLEAEQACDDRVLQSGTDRADYAERLLRIAAGAKQASLRRLPAVAMARSSQLATRIEALFELSRARTMALGRTRFVVTLFAMLLPAIVIGATQLDRRSPEPSPASMSVKVTRADGTTDVWASASEDAIRLQAGSYVRVRGSGAIRFLDGRRTLAPEAGGVVLVNSRVPEGSWMVRDETLEILGPRKRDRWIVERWDGEQAPEEGTRIYDTDSEATARIDSTAEREFFLRIDEKSTEFYLPRNEADRESSRNDSGGWNEDGDADESPLYAAIRRGNGKLVRELLEVGSDPNARWQGDGTPLIIAVRAGDDELIDLLLERGARPDLGVGGDGNALIVAASMGDLRSLRRFIATGADIDLGVEGDGNPLIAAAGAGKLEAMKLLVESGADVEAVVPGDENALIQAVEHGQLEAVRYLISIGADVNARVPVKSWRTGRIEIRTPLSRALEGGYPAIARLLRSAGATD